MRLARLLCRIFGHRPHYWEGGHVHACDDWEGDRLADGTPWVGGFTTCDRCQERL